MEVFEEQAVMLFLDLPRSEPLMTWEQWTVLIFAMDSVSHKPIQE